MSVLTGVPGGQINGGFRMPGFRLHVDCSYAGTVADGHWHHVALVYDPTWIGNDRVRLYLDYVQQPDYLQPPDWITSNADLFFRNEPFFIGSRNNNAYKFTGERDDIKITGAALSTEEFMHNRSYFGATVIKVQ